MNDCVKTGFSFRELETGLIRIGDLFYFSGYFQIRGIPRGVKSNDTPVDAVVSDCIICQRANSEYSDSQIGIKIIDPTDEFVEYINKWYPYLKLIIVKEEKDGQAS